MIPDTTKEKIIRSMGTFDEQFRHLEKWSGWEKRENYKYAIKYNDRLYPVKQIISLAAEISLSSFSGGEESNKFLAKKGFDIIALHPVNMFEGVDFGDDVGLRETDDIDDIDDIDRDAVDGILLNTRSSNVKDIVKAVVGQGFVFEPWQIAAYVTALRTKPFVILAGVSGTGKSKLPALVAQATRGEVKLISVRPDWTDSSDVLGYTDLRGTFRPGPLLELVKKATEERDKHFVCIMDEMNLARVEHYFAEILSHLEDRRAVYGGGYASGPLLSQSLQGSEAYWSNLGLPPNLVIVGTVNMDESSHGFSRKVLDRAFTIEFSDVDLTSWENQTKEVLSGLAWPVTAWYPRAAQLAEIGQLNDEEKKKVQEVIEVLSVMNRYLIQAQLQVGYRTRDEIALFVLHAEEISSSFVTRLGESVNPLDLALQMKVLPRIAGGSNSIRNILFRLLGWAYNGQPFKADEDASSLLKIWDNAGRPGFIEGATFPRTAGRLCLMWDRLLTEGYTSFWL